MSYEFYRILHLVFICTLLFSLGGLWAFYSSNNSKDRFVKRTLLTLHGLSLFIIFVAGFGLIAKLKIPTPWPQWIYIKLFMWLVLSLFPFFLRKKWLRFLSKKTNSIVSLILLLLVIIVLVVSATKKVTLF